MKKYTIHIVGLAHLPTSPEYNSCAFTQKNIKAAKMFASLGHKVFIYGARGKKTLFPEKNITFVETHTPEDIAADYGMGDNRFEVGYNWQSVEFKHDFNDEKKKPSTEKFYRNCIKEITLRTQEDHFLYITQGYYQKVIADELSMQLTVEGGIGYRGSFAQYRAFESNYLRYFTYGSEHPFQSINGNYYDRIIPNYFSPDEYQFCEKKEDYFLYVGRIIDRKGIHTAWRIAKELGVKLYIAGQNGVVQPDGSLTDRERREVNIPAGNWEYLGSINVNDRIRWMKKARAVITPTIYLEAFAGVHVEAMLCGTPVITTDFGVFTDTVINGFNGYRCSTLADFIEAGHFVKHLDPAAIHQDAVRKYSTEQVRGLYQKWFDDLYNVYTSIKTGQPVGWSNLSSVQNLINGIQKD